MQHLDEGTIHAWLDGALPATKVPVSSATSRNARECASLVAEARGMIAGASRIVSALDIVPGGVTSPHGRNRRRAHSGARCD